MNRKPVIPNNYFNETLSSTVGSATATTIPVSAPPGKDSGILTIENDSATAREIIYYTSKDASNVYCPSWGRGLGGTTAQTHDAGASIMDVPTSVHMAGLIDGIVNGLRPTNYSAVYNSSTAIDVTGDVTAEATTGRILRINFATSGWKNFIISKSSYTSPNTTITLEGNEVPNETISEVLIDISPAGAEIMQNDGWIHTNETWTYVSATSFKITGVDKTGKYQKGDKIKLTDVSTTYFYITDVSFSTDTTITITGESDLSSGAITNPYYSKVENPQGFPDGKNVYKARVYMSANQVISDSVQTVMNLDTKMFDPNNNFDTATYSYTVPVTGYYQVNTRVRFAQYNTYRYYRFFIELWDGTNVIGRGDDNNIAATSGYDNGSSTIADMLYLTAGTVLQARCYQSSLTAINQQIDTANVPKIKNYLSIHFLGV